MTAAEAEFRVIAQAGKKIALTQANGTFSAVRMVAVLWSHGPTMLERMKQQNIAWPPMIRSARPFAPLSL